MEADEQGAAMGSNKVWGLCPQQRPSGFSEEVCWLPNGPGIKKLVTES